MLIADAMRLKNPEWDMLPLALSGGRVVAFAANVDPLVDGAGPRSRIG
jgi:hypothetical protein